MEFELETYGDGVVDIMMDMTDKRFKEICQDFTEFGETIAFIMDNILTTSFILKGSKVEFKSYETRMSGLGNKLHVFRFECKKEN